MRKTLILMTFLVSSLLTSSAPAKPLEIGVVLDLLDARVSGPAIRHYVERNRFTFDLSADDLKALKKAGASDDLVAFLQSREEGQNPALSVEGRAKIDERSGSKVRGEGDEAVGEDDEYGTTAEGDYGVAYSSPDYAYDFYYAYPTYYPTFYYPYYYYPSYFHLSAYYPSYSFRTRGSGVHLGSGSGVYSYWYRNHASRSGARFLPSGTRSHPSSGVARGHGRGRH